VLVAELLGPFGNAASVRARRREPGAHFVRGSKGPAAPRVRWSAGVLRIGAWDADPEPPDAPAELNGSVIDEGGRGLAPVRACSDLWGRQPLSRFGDRGTYVWCELAGQPRQPGVTSRAS
ncbi:hypothetical protein ABZ678_17465, partial [Streptomyces hirsutus]